METTEFLKTALQRCEYKNGIECSHCVLACRRNCLHHCLGDYLCVLQTKGTDGEDYFGTFVEQVGQWAKDHPIQHKKTRNDIVLAKFPNVKLDKDGIIDTCPNFPLYSSGTERCEQYKRNCDVCRRDYWLEEVGSNGRS